MWRQSRACDAQSAFLVGVVTYALAGHLAAGDVVQAFGALRHQRIVAGMQGKTSKKGQSSF